MAKSKQSLSEIDKNYVAGFLGSQQVKIVLPMIIPFHLNVGVTLCVSCGLTQQLPLLSVYMFKNNILTDYTLMPQRY